MALHFGRNASTVVAKRPPTEIASSLRRLTARSRRLAFPANPGSFPATSGRTVGRLNRYAGQTHRTTSPFSPSIVWTTHRGGRLTHTTHTPACLACPPTTCPTNQITAIVILGLAAVVVQPFLLPCLNLGTNPNHQVKVGRGPYRNGCRCRGALFACPGCRNRLKELTRGPNADFR